MLGSRIFMLGGGGGGGGVKGRGGPGPTARKQP